MIDLRPYFITHRNGIGINMYLENSGHGQHFFVMNKKKCLLKSQKMIDSHTIHIVTSEGRSYLIPSMIGIYTVAKRER